MVWFNVDDTLCSHPKARAAGLPAMGLWVVAGAWSAQYLKGGLVEEWFVTSWPNGRNLAKRLVDAGLWHADPAGWRFHQWDDRQRTKEEVETKRAADRERQRQYRAEKAAKAAKELAGHVVTDSVTNAVTNSAHTEPSRTEPVVGFKSSNKGAAKLPAREAEVPPCPKHLDGNPKDEPCGRCRDRRRWEEAQPSADELAKQRAVNLRKNCATCHGTNFYGDPDNPTRCNHGQRKAS